MKIQNISIWRYTNRKMCNSVIHTENKNRGSILYPFLIKYTKNGKNLKIYATFSICPSLVALILRKVEGKLRWSKFITNTETEAADKLFE